MLANTIRDRETLRFDYAAHDAAVAHEQQPLPPRSVEPHHLVTSHGGWYLVAWDLDRNDWRLYSVDRLLPRTPHGPRITPRTVPGGDVNDFLSARFKGSNVNAWPFRGTVILHLAARDVLPFAGDGTVTAIDELTRSLEAGSWSGGGGQ